MCQTVASDAIDGTHEVETVIGDFAAGDELLARLRSTPKSYQEIEADTRDEVLRVAGLLDYSQRQLTGENTVKVYSRYGIELSEIRDLRW